MADFQVEAELLVNAGRAQAGLNALSSRLGGIGSALRGTNGMLGGAVGQIVAFGSAYVGVHAVMGAFTSLTREAFEFTRTVEGAKIGIATMVSAFQEIPFEQAEAQANGMYAQIQAIAIRTSATSSELLETYQVMYAGMASAGMTTDRQMTMLAGTATAAAAYMSNDVAQTARDMGMMMEGRAGAQVKLWNRIKGVIHMTAEEWNNLTAPERAARLEAMLSTPAMTAAADRYALSFDGILSTSRDIKEQLSGVFFSAAMGKFSTWLNTVNTRIIANRAAVDAFLTKAGSGMARLVEATAVKAESVFVWISRNWEEIVYRARETLATIRHWAPLIKQYGVTFLKAKLAATALGIAFQSGAWIASALSAVSALTAMMGVGAGGAAVAGAGAAAGGAGAAAGGAGAAGAAAGGVALGPLIAVVAAIVAAGAAIYEGWTWITERFSGWAEYWITDIQTIFGGVFNDLKSIFSDLWTFIRPLFGAAGGGVIATVLNALRLLGGIIRWMLLPIKFLAKGLTHLSWLVDIVSSVFGGAITLVTTLFGELGSALSRLVTWIDSEAEELRTPKNKRNAAPGATPAAGRQAAGGQAAAGATPGTGAPNDRTTTVNDFRGSNVHIEQTFREADPDRVAVRMIEDLQRFAEQRVQSRFGQAITR